jgi:hypothetical protein
VVVAEGVTVKVGVRMGVIVGVKLGVGVGRLACRRTWLTMNNPAQ